ncbi:MAG: nucleotidyl transferase AbiEii/AbiGii toxin family protein [Actinomycetota bacterium]
MNSLEATLRDTVSKLNQLETRFALVGGLAVSVRVEPRLTRDIDLAVAIASDREAEALVASLERPVEFLVEQEAMKRLATARLQGNHGDIVVDLLFASSGIEKEIVDAADTIAVFRDVRLPVATVGHLIALKLLSTAQNRPQDQIDIHALRGVANQDDIAQAREAVSLITSRGFARGRDLAASLDALMRVRDT